MLFAGGPAIEKAIRSAELGLNPDETDGKMIRVVAVPALYAVSAAGNGQALGHKMLEEASSRQCDNISPCDGNYGSEGTKDKKINEDTRTTVGWRISKTHLSS